MFPAGSFSSLQRRFLQRLALQAEVEQLRIEAQQLRIEVQQFSKALADMCSSTSWRVTAPLRAISGRLRAKARGGMRSKRHW
jgi:hypothetical protein